MRHDGAVHFVLRDGELVHAADLVEQESKSHAAVGDPAEFLALLLFGRVLVREGLARL